MKVLVRQLEKHTGNNYTVYVMNILNVVYMFLQNPNITRNFSKTMLYDAEDVENFL